MALRTPANLQSDNGIEIFTPFEAVSTRGTTVFVPGLLELYEVDIWKDFCFGDGALFSPDGAGSTNPRLEFSHLAGRYRPGESPFLSPVCGGASSTSPGLEFPHRAGRYRPFSSPVCWSCRYVEGFLIWGWAPILPGWLWLYELNPRLGFTHRVGRYRPGGSPFSSPVSSDAGSMHRRLGFHTVRGGIDPEDTRIRPQFVRVDVWKDF